MYNKLKLFSNIFSTCIISYLHTWLPTYLHNWKLNCSFKWAKIVWFIKSRTFHWKCIIFFLNQVFCKILCYLAELFHQIVCYLAELFHQIAFPFTLKGSPKSFRKKLPVINSRSSLLPKIIAEINHTTFVS